MNNTATTKTIKAGDRVKTVYGNYETVLRVNDLQIFTGPNTWYHPTKILTVITTDRKLEIISENETALKAQIYQLHSGGTCLATVINQCAVVLVSAGLSNELASTVIRKWFDEAVCNIT